MTSFAKNPIRQEEKDPSKHMSIQTVHRFFVLFTLGVMCFLGIHTFAAPDTQEEPDLVIRYTKPIATPENPLTDQDLEAQTMLHEGLALGDATLAFSIRVPTQWSEKTPFTLTPPATADETESGKEERGLANKVSEEVARYEGNITPNGRSYITIEVINMPYHITAAQWLLYYILNEGYILEGFMPEGDQAVQASYVFFHESQAMFARVRAQRSGHRLLIARYVIPVERRQTESGLQSAIVDRFSLTNPAPGPAESVRTHLFLDIARMNYPVSWHFSAPPVRSIDRMNADLFNITADNLLAGEIRVVLLSRYAGRPLEEEVNALKDIISQKNLALGAKIPLGIDISYPAHMTMRVTEVYQAQGTDPKQKIVPQEFWFTFMKGQDYIYIATLLTAARENDYFAWARNVEAYKLIVSSLETQKTQSPQKSVAP